MTPREGLERTRTLLMEKGWCKHDVVTAEGQHCLFGAVLDSGGSIGAQMRYLNRALGESDWTCSAGPVAYFNDADETTFNDVIGVIDEAIILAKEDEAA